MQYDRGVLGPEWSWIWRPRDVDTDIGAGSWFPKVWARWNCVIIHRDKRLFSNWSWYIPNGGYLLHEKWGASRGRLMESIWTCTRHPYKEQKFYHHRKRSYDQEHQVSEKKTSTGQSIPRNEHESWQQASVLREMDRHFVVIYRWLGRNVSNNSWSWNASFTANCEPLA